MKRLLPVCLIAWLGSACGQAGPVEGAIVAAMRLSEQPNYSWVATISDDARTYDVVGQTIRGGCTRVKMPVVNSVRRQLGRSVTDTQVDLIFLGNVACVIETDDGWKKPDELWMPEPADADSSPLLGSTGHAPLLGPRSGPRTGSILRGGRPSASRDAERRGYSNLQLAVSHPHEELGVIVGSHRDLTVEGDVVSGTLSDIGAQLLLVRDGQDKVTPLRASGTFKLFLRDGMVVKYQVRLEGTLEVKLPVGRRQVNISQTTETILKDIGKTQFEVPWQARAKLGV